MNKLSFAPLICSIIFALSVGDLCEAATTWDNEIKHDKELKAVVSQWKCNSTTWKGVPNVIKEKHIECRHTYPRTNAEPKTACVKVCMWMKIGAIDYRGVPNNNRIQELGTEMHGGSDPRRVKEWFGLVSDYCTHELSDHKDEYRSFLRDEKYNKTMSGNCPLVEPFVACRHKYDSGCMYVLRKPEYN